MLRLAVFASGEGTTLQTIAKACSAGRLAAEIAVVICNNRDSGALRRARELSLPYAHLSAITHPEPESLDSAILDALNTAKVEVVVLAGYLKKIGPKVLRAFAGRILNTHPALLPKFGGQGMYGNRVHEAVLAAGEKVTGVSVHVVTGEYDAGPVIAQTEVPVLAGDNVATLSARVQETERSFLVAVLQSIAAGSSNLSVGSGVVDIHRVQADQLLTVHELLCINGWQHRIDNFGDFCALVENSQVAEVAVIGGQVVGFIRGITDGQSNGYLSMLVVALEHRGKGVGRKLVEHLIDGKPQITWVLRAGRDGSKEFFAKLGFEGSIDAMERRRT